MLKKIAIFTGSAVTARTAPFVTLPFITRTLEAGEYGMGVLAQLVATLVLCVAGANIQTIVMRNFFRADRSRMKRVVSTAVATIVTSHAAAIVVVYLVAITWFGPTVFGISSAAFALLVGAVSLVQSLNAVHMAVKRCEGAAWRFAFHEITQASLSVVTLLVLVLNGFGWVAVPLALLMSFAVVSLLGMLELHRTGLLIVAAYRDEFIEIVRICTPQIIHLLGTVALAVSDRFIVQWAVGPAGVGIYAAYYTLGTGAVVLIDGIVRVWSPQVYRLLSESEERARELISVVTQGLVFAFILLLGLYVLVIYWLADWILVEEYAGYFPVFLLVAGGYFFQGIYKLMFPLFIHFSHSGRVATINVFGAALNIALCLLLVERYGLYGIAFATLAAFAMIAVAMYVSHARFYRLDLFSAFQPRKFVEAFRD